MFECAHTVHIVYQFMFTQQYNQSFNGSTLLSSRKSNACISNVSCGTWANRCASNVSNFDSFFCNLVCPPHASTSGVNGAGPISVSFISISLCFCSVSVL
eukprot:470324_1